MGACSAAVLNGGGNEGRWMRKKGRQGDKPQGLWRCDARIATRGQTSHVEWGCWGVSREV